jgi:hypothetical protein
VASFPRILRFPGRVLRPHYTTIGEEAHMWVTMSRPRGEAG